MSQGQLANVTVARLNQALRMLGIVVKSDQATTVAACAEALNQMGVNNAQVDSFLNLTRSILQPPAQPRPSARERDLPQGYEGDDESDTSSDNDDIFHDAQVNPPSSPEVSDTHHDSSSQSCLLMGQLVDGQRERDDPGELDAPPTLDEIDLEREEVYFTGGTPDYHDPYHTDTDHNADVPIGLDDLLPNTFFDQASSSRYADSSEDEGEYSPAEHHDCDYTAEETFFTGRQPSEAVTYDPYHTDTDYNEQCEASFDPPAITCEEYTARTWGRQPGQGSDENTWSRRRQREIFGGMTEAEWHSS